MIALYDNIIGDQKLSFEQFKQMHQKSALFSKSIAKQAFIVKNLQDVISRNNYQGIDDAFNLYMVMRQERDLIGAQYALDDNDLAIQIAEKKLSKPQRDELLKIRARKAQLKQEVMEEDYFAMEELATLLNKEKLDATVNLNQ